MTEENEVDVNESPMTFNETIKMINECIVPVENWKIEELADGKEIDVFPEWHEYMDKIVWEYRKVGWLVYHYIHGDREFLNFANPNKHKFNPRF